MLWKGSSQVQLGEKVLYVGCGHDEPCGELVRPCSVDLYGVMEISHVRRDGRVVARLGYGDFEVFDAMELDTVAAVADRAVLQQAIADA